MKTRNLLVVIAGVALAATTVRAAQWEDRFRYERDTADKFPPHELSIDLFGTYATKDRWGGHNGTEHGVPLEAGGVPGKEDQGGGGLGVNYFFSRYLGIGADSYIEEWKAPYRVNGNVFLRYPLDRVGGIAPYVFGGGGREFKYNVQWTYHGGGGVEFRFNRFTGIFGDARRVFSDKHSDFDYTLVRGGLRLAF